MLASNPFTERTFSGPRSSNLSSSMAYDRHYFPYTPQRNTTLIKPGFLITNDTNLPSVACDLRSPYSSLSYNQEPRRNYRNQYVQNPFYKSHLLEDVDYANGKGTYTGGYYGGMVESKVAPVYSTTDYTPGINVDYTNNNSYEKKGSKQSNQGSKFGLKRVNSQQQFGENNKFNEAYRNYNDTRPIIEQISTGISKKPSGGIQQYPYQKKQSKQSAGSPTYPRQSPYSKPDAPVIASIIQRISEHPSQSNIDHDDPMNYNLPSFNQKFLKKQTLQSPTFSNPYANSNANPTYQHQHQRQRYDDDTWTKNKTSNAASGGYYAGTGNTGVMTDNQRVQNTGTQPRHGRADGMPSSISYKGKVYYQVHVDQL